MLEVLLVLLLVGVLSLVVVLVLLYRRLWLLMGSIECLCSHIGTGHHA
jgi:hypothetical protein